MEYLGDARWSIDSDWTFTGDLPYLSIFNSSPWARILRGVQLSPSPEQRMFPWGERVDDARRPESPSRMPLRDLYEFVPLGAGMNAIYGLNGAGKSRFLRRFVELLEGRHGPEEGLVVDVQQFFRSLDRDKVNWEDADWATGLTRSVVEGLKSEWWIACPLYLTRFSEWPDSVLDSSTSLDVTNLRCEITDESFQLLAEVLREGQLLLTRPYGTQSGTLLVVPFLPPGVRPPLISKHVANLRAAIVEFVHALIPEIDQMSASDSDDPDRDYANYSDARRDHWPNLTKTWLGSPLANCRNLRWGDSEGDELDYREAMHPWPIPEAISPVDARALHVDSPDLLVFNSQIPLYFPPIARVGVAGWNAWRRIPQQYRYFIESDDDPAAAARLLTREHLHYEVSIRKQDAEEVAVALSAHAAETYARLLPASPSLSLELGQPVDWLKDDYPTWRLGQRSDLAEGSLAQQRWAYLAIARAVSPSTSFVILDEPEAGLHRTAEAAMAANLASRDLFGDAVIVAATHSPEILDQPEANLLFARAYEPLRAMREGDRAFPEFLGLRRSDLLSGTRVLLLVEGEHDRVVLRHLLGKALDQLGVHILALRGAKNASAVVDSQFLFDFSDATMVVLLDNLEAGTLQDVWSRARKLTEEGKRTEAWRSIEATIKDKDGEAKFIRDFMSRALEQHRYDRVEVFALHEPDVIYYLPHDKFTGSDPWSKVKTDYAKYRSHSKTAKSLKNWIAERYGTPANSTELIAEAVAEMDLPPAEFVGLLSFLQGVVRGE